MYQQKETIGTVHLWDYNLKTKANDDKCHCLWMPKISGKKHGKTNLQFSLTWFVLIWKHTSGCPQYFLLTEGNFWNTAKCKTTFSTKPNPEVYNLLLPILENSKEEAKGILKRGSFMRSLQIVLLFVYLTFYLLLKCTLYLAHWFHLKRVFLFFGQWEKIRYKRTLGW